MCRCVYNAEGSRWTSAKVFAALAVQVAVLVKLVRVSELCVWLPGENRDTAPMTADIMRDIHPETRSMLHTPRSCSSGLTPLPLQAVFTYTGQPSAAAEDEEGEQQDTNQQQQQQQQQHGSLQAPLQDQQGTGQLQAAQLAEVQLQLGGTALQLWCRQPALSGDAAMDEPAAASGAQAAAQALAALVLACPAYFNGAAVLELCSWDAPLASLAALRWCRLAVAAGPGQAAVALLRRNAQHNSHLFIIERLRLQQLAWRGPAVQQQDQQQQRQQQQGSMQQQERQLRQAFPDGFQAVLACVPPVDEDLHGLLAAASVQLSRQPGALLLLCGGSDAAVRRAAAAAAALGLRQAVPLPAELDAAALLVAESTSMHFLGLQTCK